MRNSAAEIIEAKGGPAAFAAKVNRRPGAVRAWKHRNYFPREAWPEIISAFPDLALKKLMEIEAQRDWEHSPKQFPTALGSPKNRGSRRHD